jgi:3-deoxy-D-manno-octulosonic-acid transferase
MIYVILGILLFIVAVGILWWEIRKKREDKDELKHRLYSSYFSNANKQDIVYKMRIRK